MSWPLVASDDDGIRPAGPPDRCFYCGGPVGQPHAPDCVCVKKRVRLRYSFILDVDVPHGWDEDQILFHRNDSSWCADNALYELEASTGDDACLCPRFECFFESIADDTPRRKTCAQEGEEDDEPAAPEDASWRTCSAAVDRALGPIPKMHQSSPAIADTAEIDLPWPPAPAAVGDRVLAWDQECWEVATLDWCWVWESGYVPVEGSPCWRPMPPAPDEEEIVVLGKRRDQPLIELRDSQHRRGAEVVARSGQVVDDQRVEVENPGDETS